MQTSSRWNERRAVTISASGGGPGTAKSRLSVLLVEDDFDLREALAEHLIDAGFEVHSASDGRDAIASRRPDVIVADLMMPRMNGWELLDEVRKRDQPAPIPVVVVTAARNAGLVPKGHPVFLKPLNVDGLVQAIQALAVHSPKS